MRIPITYQLGAVVLLFSLTALAVVSIATWITNRNFVLANIAGQLTLTASLKAAQLSSNLLVMQTSVQAVSTRVLIQQSLGRYNAGNNSADNWAETMGDLGSALAGGQQAALLLQAALFPRDNLGPAGSSSLVNVTGNQIGGTIKLPYTYANGTSVYLGDTSFLGYPPQLYPNFTYPANGSSGSANISLDGQALDQDSNILLGPWEVNSTFSLISITMPLVNNTLATEILGWLTVVLDARHLYAVLYSAEGLQNTGVTLLVGPTTPDNVFPAGILYNDNSTTPPEPAGQVQVHFVLQPIGLDNGTGRHSSRLYGQPNDPFPISAYPAVQEGLTTYQSAIDNAGSMVSTNNEENVSVSVGFAMPQTKLCEWLLLVELSQTEVWAPIRNLRTILLACVFGTAGGMLLLVFPLAHFSSRPIRRLRAATKASVSPPSHDSDDRSLLSFEADRANTGDQHSRGGSTWKAFVTGFTAVLRNSGSEKQCDDKDVEVNQRSAFRIPGKVKDGKHIIHDELTDLTTTFNDMTDELMTQYERLEERVQQRTAELELSKKAAEAANESKTLFIANISHELKTPLNGIMGMTAVCMQEDDLARIKRSLGIIYKSGDLLLNLLTDLLTFSKNQVGQQLSLDEKEFRIRDLSSQIRAIFDKQAKEGIINFKISYSGVPTADEVDIPGRSDFGPPGTGRVKNMYLWGDQHRLLQIIINLVSNSLKFTPPGGTVELRVRCLGETTEGLPSRQGSLQSRASTKHSRLEGLSRQRGLSDNSVATRTDTANAINARDGPKLHQTVSVTERSATPPPNTIKLMFEFEVEDTGPGIPDSQQRSIFEPFVQGDLGLSKKFGGTGLGLSICSQLATLMRGTISLKSEQGIGSTFTLRIPLKHIASRADSKASSIILPAPGRNSSSDDELDDMFGTLPASKSDGAPTPLVSDSNPRLVGLSQPFFAANPSVVSPGSQKKAALQQVVAATTEASERGDKVRVLVAEDNKVNQEVVLRMLKLEDIYNVELAKDGQEALDRVKESMVNGKPYDLIFMDVQMPNLDGLASTRLIRQTGYTAPIVALTAFSEESNVKECIDSGMNYFLAKPIRRPALKKVLKTYCPPILEAEEGDTSPKLTTKLPPKERLAGAADETSETATSKELATEQVVPVGQG